MFPTANQAVRGEVKWLRTISGELVRIDETTLVHWLLGSVGEDVKHSTQHTCTQTLQVNRTPLVPQLDNNLLLNDPRVVGRAIQLNKCNV
ncbi:MAG: hypothetical protein EBR93_04945 [Bacteroidetes bacterium]|nr:hypothetical protein [Bacteroidota bacterium]